MGVSISAKLSATILSLAVLCAPACAEASQSVNPSNAYVERVVEAIYRAEGGRKTRHPYGVLSVKSNDPRRTCYEVVNWRYAMWVTMPAPKPDFITYLSRSYCPIGAKNDPRGLNRNWVKNVSYFMAVAK